MSNEAMPQPVAKRPSLIKTAVYLVLMALMLGAIVWYFRKDFTYLLRHPGAFWDVQLGFVGLALLALLFTSVLDLFIWNRMLAWFTEPLPFPLLTPVYMWSYLARYIPGKVGSLLLRVGLGMEAGREPVPVLAASAVELALRTASALFLFLIGLWGWAAMQNRLLLVSMVALIPLVLACAHPRVMLPVLNWILQKMKRQPITRHLRYGEVLGLFGALVGRWALFGVGFYLLALAVYPPLQSQAVALIGLAPGSWAIGFLSMLPGGLGSMDAVVKAVLNLLLVPSDKAFILVLQFRLLTLLGEGLWSLAAIPLWRIGKRSVAQVAPPQSLPATE